MLHNTNKTKNFSAKESISYVHVAKCLKNVAVAIAIWTNIKMLMC